MTILLIAPTTPFYSDLASKLGAIHMASWDTEPMADIVIFAINPAQKSVEPISALLKISLSSQLKEKTAGIHHFPLPLKLQQLQTFITQRQAAWTKLNGHTIDSVAGTIYQHATGQKTPLTERELALLQYLAQHPEGARKEAILSTVWQYDKAIDSHTLESHLHRLRQKLPILESQDGRYFLTTASA